MREEKDLHKRFREMSEIQTKNVVKYMHATYMNGTYHYEQTIINHYNKTSDHIGYI